ncbi:MAG: Fe-S cluster assembly protein SufD [Schaalia hyovaginalis]|uniref:Fe-S cluster assembly protein SufD n=1 Tax=Schaalia hyovaginalis TaxID=29316 RepID=UPI002A834804|nr:Fe-S cluster assembly protein SufD [Schaalia hyovaginalis]MDY4262273.1 Fe-S cluster assembly protein SufD [Schaalia hyovaginalis]MDY6213250.1 Fe-S cluster assembly protein SufD [Schaalia hyovaginalis]
MTTEYAMATPHSHGAVGKGGHASRADRPTSFDLDAIPVPGGREEDWRFTPMRRIEKLFETGNYAEGDAPLRVQAPEGVLVERVDRRDPRLGTVLAPGDRTAVVAWNAFENSTVVAVPKGAVITEPIRVEIDAVEDVRAQHLRIEVGELAEATIILTHRGSAGAALNQTVEFSAGDASKATLVSIQEWDDTTLHASNHRLSLGKDAKFTHIVVTFGGDLVRISSDTDFRGTGGELTMLGLYFVDAGQHLEHRVFVDHSQPDCYSRVTYKGALQGQDAHAVWIGDCLIREAADDTDTYELNRNLVLTEGAKADSVPNLEIENGEIKGAGHASATGRFDDEQLFYLMSRGVSEADARRLVVRGFFAELINQIGVPEVVDHLMESVEAELAKSRTI